MVLGDLTARQSEVLDMIRWFSQQQPTIPPTLRELSEKLNLSSVGTTQAHIKELQAKGWVDWTPNKSRTLVITPAAKEYFQTR